MIENGKMILIIYLSIYILGFLLLDVPISFNGIGGALSRNYICMYVTPSSGSYCILLMFQGVDMRYNTITYYDSIKRVNKPLCLQTINSYLTEIGVQFKMERTWKLEVAKVWLLQ